MPLLLLLATFRPSRVLGDVGLVVSAALEGRCTPSSSAGLTVAATAQGETVAATAVGVSTPSSPIGVTVNDREIGKAEAA